MSSTCVAIFHEQAHCAPLSVSQLFEMIKLKLRTRSRSYQFLSSSDDKTVKLWQTNNDGSITLLKSFENHHKKYIYCVLINKFASYGPHTNEFISVGEDQTIRSWYIETNEPFNTITSEHSIWTAVWWKQGQYLIEAGCSSGPFTIIVRKWNSPDKGKIIYKLHEHTDSIYALLVDELGDKMWSCGRDGAIILWDLNSAKLVKKIHVPKTIHRALCKVNSNLLVSVGYDMIIRFWSLQDYTCIHQTPKAHQRIIRSVLYSKREKVLITASEDATVNLWNLHVNEQQVQCTLKHTITNPYKTWCLALAFYDGDEYDATRVLVGDNSGNLLVVQLSTGAILQTVERAHKDSVRSFSFLK